MLLQWVRNWALKSGLSWLTGGSLLYILLHLHNMFAKPRTRITEGRDDSVWWYIAYESRKLWRLKGRDLKLSSWQDSLGITKWLMVLYSGVIKWWGFNLDSFYCWSWRLDMPLESHGLLVGELEQELVLWLLHPFISIQYSSESGLMVGIRWMCALGSCTLNPSPG